MDAIHVLRRSYAWDHTENEYNRQIVVTLATLPITNRQAFTLITPTNLLRSSMRIHNFTIIISQYYNIIISSSSIVVYGEVNMNIVLKNP